MVMALLERAPRQHGLCSCEAPPLAFALHPVLDHRTARRLDDAGPHGQTHRQVRVGRHPAPMVVEARDDVGARLPPRRPPPLLCEDVSQAADDVAHPATEYRRQLLLHPVLARLGGFLEPGVGRAPEGADARPDVQDTRHALPRLEELGRQAPQAEGTIEPDDQGCAVWEISALGVGLDALHHRLLRPHQAGEPTDRLGAGRVVRHVVPLPARTCRFRLDQQFRERFGSPGLGIDRVADPHPRCLLLLPRLAAAQLGFALNRRLLHHRHALAVNTDDEPRSLGFLPGHGPLRLEGLVVRRRLLRHRHQDALSKIEVKERLEHAGTVLEGMLDLEPRHPFLQEVGVAPLGKVDLLVQRDDPVFPGSAVAGPGHRERAKERAVVPSSQCLLPCQEHPVGPRDGRSDIARPALGKGPLHRRQAARQPPLEDTLLRFVRLECAPTLPRNLQQCLECPLSCCSTRLDLDRFQRDPPDRVNHRNIAQMFPGCYHRRRIPCTWKPSSRAALSPNSFPVHSSLFLSRPQEPIPGVLVVTTSALFVQQWDKANGRYEPMKRFSLNETLKVSLDTFGLNRRLVVQWKDFSTDSFSFTSDSGQTVDAERTEAAFQLLSSKLLSNGN
jgi:hypothetical protein